MSPLRQALIDYLAVRRSLGFKLGRAEGLLLQFVNYAEERGEQAERAGAIAAGTDERNAVDRGTDDDRLSRITPLTS